MAVIIKILVWNGPKSPADSSPNSVLKKLSSLWVMAAPDVYFSGALVPYLSDTPTRRGPSKSCIVHSRVPGEARDCLIAPLRAHHFVWAHFLYMSCSHVLLSFLLNQRTVSLHCGYAGGAPRSYLREVRGQHRGKAK